VKTGGFLPSDDSHIHPYRPTFLNYKSGDHGTTWDTEVGFYTDPGAPSTRKSYPGIIKAGFIYNGSKAGSNLSPILGPSGFFNYSTGVQEDHNYTFYVQANQPVWRVAAGSNRGVDVTFGVNTGPQSKSKVPTEFTGGVIFNGPIPGRAKDGLAFGMVYSKVGNDYNTFVGPLLALNNETQFEVNYKIQVFPWFVLQPVYQYYNNVGGTSNSASIAGFRLVTTF
jgi:carbohydrate-selective porin OprB